MPKNARKGLTQVNLELCDRNLLNNMVKASGASRAEFVSSLIHREAQERGLSPKKPDYGPKGKCGDTP